MDGLNEPQSAQSVGKVLRARRIRAGLTLSELAFDLQIRPRLLEAIEAGEYQALPAGIYAEGFVRAYARAVGMDAGTAAERFRAETGDDRAPALKFPDPQPETGIPNGAALFVGTIMAIVAYGAWYLSSGAPQQVAQAVAPVPAHLEERLLANEPGATMPSVPREAPFIPGIAAAPPAGGNGAQGHVPATVLPEFIPAAGTPASPRALPPSNVGQLAKPGTGSPTKGAPVALLAAKGDSAPSVDTPLAAGVSSVAPTSAPAAAAPVQTSSPPPPATATSQASVALAAEPPHEEAALSAADGRVVLRARSDSWVEIRDPASNTLVTARLLRAGESYRLPDRPGLRLLTGNAGGLQIFVDGHPAPPLGRDGTVRRNVPLDAGLLTAALDRNN